MKTLLIIIGILMTILSPFEGVFISRYFNFELAENIAIVVSVFAQMVVGILLIVKNTNWEL